MELPGVKRLHAGVMEVGWKARKKHGTRLKPYVIPREADVTLCRDLEFWFTECYINKMFLWSRQWLQGMALHLGCKL